MRSATNSQFTDYVCLTSGGIDSAMAVDLLCQHRRVKIWPVYILRGAASQQYELSALKAVLSGFASGTVREYVD